MNGYTLASDIGEMIPIVVTLGALILAGFCVAVSAVRSVSATRAREQTKREVAAYMAEGTISAEDAERILREDPRKRSC